MTFRPGPGRSFLRTSACTWSGRTPDEPARRRIKEIERLRARLARVIKPEFIAEWLSTPNEGFDRLKPLEVIERGGIDRLWDMIFYLESGIAS
jgi:hypothetical protein